MDFVPAPDGLGQMLWFGLDFGLQHQGIGLIGSWRVSICFSIFWPTRVQSARSHARFGLGFLFVPVGGPIPSLSHGYLIRIHYDKPGTQSALLSL
jgi:hypothetical protein